MTPTLNIEYTTRFNDYSFIAQHNYFGLIAIRGWYDETMMKSCTTLVAIWRLKATKQ